MLGRLLVELELIADTQFAVPTYQAAASLALWRGDPADARRVADVAWDRVRTTEDWVLAAPTASTLLGVAAEVAEAARDRRDLGTLAAIHARAEAVLAEVERIVDRSGLGRTSSRAGRWTRSSPPERRVAPAAG